MINVEVVRTVYASRASLRANEKQPCLLSLETVYSDCKFITLLVLRLERSSPDSCHFDHPCGLHRDGPWQTRRFCLSISTDCLLTSEISIAADIYILPQPPFMYRLLCIGLDKKYSTGSRMPMQCHGSRLSDWRICTCPA